MESQLLSLCALFAVLLRVASCEGTPEFTSIRQLKSGPVRGLISHVEKGGKKVEFYQGIKYGMSVLSFLVKMYVLLKENKNDTF